MRFVSFRILLLLLLMTSLDGICQQGKFYSNLLEEMSNSIPASAFPLDYPKDTVVLCKGIINEASLPVSIMRDEYGIIDHIGYCFFNRVDRNAVIKDPIVLFVERLFLQMLISPAMDDLLTIYSLKGLDISVDNVRLLPGQDIPKDSLFAWISGDNIMSVSKDRNQYQIDVVNSKGHSIHIMVKPSYELIYGMSKKEFDACIAYKLSNIGKLKAVQFESIQDSIWKHNNDYYMVPEINNNVTMSKDVAQAVFDKSMPRESLANVMLNALDEEFCFDVEHHSQLESISYKIQSSLFFKYFNNYDLYFGVSDSSDNCIEGTLMMLDRYTETAHMAIISTSTDDLFEQHLIKMQLYTNIPQDDYKSLVSR